MNKILSACLLLVVLLSNKLNAGEVPRWDPENTFVFAVGILEWEHPKLYPSFPAAIKNRRDRQLAEFFRSAGVPEEQVVYLEDNEATKVQAAEEFKRLLKKTDDDSLLIFYFAGHGCRNPQSHQTWLVTYDAGQQPESAWSVHDVFQAIEDHFSGGQVLLLADCCHSGALYDEAKKHRNSEIAYAALTSSYSHNTSTGNWTFSDSLLAGLRGEGETDRDANGEITLAEIAHYAEAELAFIEGQKSMLHTSKGFPGTTVFAESQEQTDGGVGERIEVEWKGKWYKAKTIDADGDEAKIHYIGFDANWDEWVGPERRRQYRPQAFAVGKQVEVRWTGDKKWYPARVLKSWNGLHFVRYENYDETWDEWIGPGAIRARE